MRRIISKTGGLVDRKFELKGFSFNVWWLDRLSTTAWFVRLRDHAVDCVFLFKQPRKGRHSEFGSPHEDDVHDYRGLSDMVMFRRLVAGLYARAAKSSNVGRGHRRRLRALELRTFL